MGQKTPVNIKKAGKWMVPAMVHRPCPMAMRKDACPLGLDSFLLKMAIEIVALAIKSHKKW